MIMKIYDEYVVYVPLRKWNVATRIVPAIIGIMKGSRSTIVEVHLENYDENKMLWISEIWRVPRDEVYEKQKIFMRYDMRSRLWW